MRLSRGLALVEVAGPADAAGRQRLACGDDESARPLRREEKEKPGPKPEEGIERNRSSHERLTALQPPTDQVDEEKQPGRSACEPEPGRYHERRETPIRRKRIAHKEEGEDDSGVDDQREYVNAQGRTEIPPAPGVVARSELIEICG
jgi:hypothetical protein